MLFVFFLLLFILFRLFLLNQRNGKQNVTLNSKNSQTFILGNATNACEIERQNTNKRINKIICTIGVEIYILLYTQTQRQKKRREVKPHTIILDIKNYILEISYLKIRLTRHWTSINSSYKYYIISYKK